MRILLAEDDRQLRASVARGLREASYSADQAGTGPQALSLAISNTYDAVILDVLLPGRSGLEVCTEIRKRGNRVPILMLTALDAIEHRIAGLEQEPRRLAPAGRPENSIRKSQAARLRVAIACSS